MISPQVIEQRKRRIERRLRRDRFVNGFEHPVFSATNIHYELSERSRAIFLRHPFDSSGSMSPVRLWRSG